MAKLYELDVSTRMNMAKLNELDTSNHSHDGLGTSKSSGSDIADSFQQSSRSFPFVATGMGYDNSCDRSVDSRSSSANPEVARDELEAVSRARLVVVLVLIAALSVLTYIMYWVVQKNERNEFETQFESYASEISSMVQDKCRSAIDSAESFSTMVTSSANEMNSSWPYVTITDFTAKALRLSTLSGAYQIGFSPILYPEDFSAWTVHSYLNLPKYYEEAIKVNGYETTVDELLNETIPFPWHYDQMNPDSGPQTSDPLEPEIPAQLLDLRERIGFNGFFVNWQSLTWLEPFHTSFEGLTTTNFNLLYAGFEDAFATAYEFNIPAFDSYRNPVIESDATEFSSWKGKTQMVQPIFDTIYSGDGSRKELKMVGALNMLFDWRSLLDDLLSKAEIHDVDIVLTSECGAETRHFTYRFLENVVIPCGSADLHLSQYDDMGLTYPLFELDLDEETQAEFEEAMAQRIENSVEGGCITEIYMSIYPIGALEESFYTGTAWLFSGVVAGVFVFTSFIFLMYDIMVKRRETKVMERLMRQEKIVSNTFPKAIRDKLYKNTLLQKDANSLSQNTLANAGSIAELYPSATVVFADIVGFTAWSSAREPNQVFKLLETIYKEFDKLAYSNNVFKVETVGDCYVAVSGLPDKCKDHALNVAKFSRDCMHRMPRLVRKLEILLGPDTAELQLRIGLNTGQVTAGVLRGDKARFQLFGDTVNTASRLETTSKAGCIHVSASTADALRKSGRERWLKPREETILVKGKGQMQTFYLETLEESIQRSKLAKYRQMNQSKDELATSKVSSSVITEEETSEEEFDEHADVSAHFDELQDELSETFKLLQTMSKSDRLVEWNVEILSYLLKQIMVARPEHQQEGNKAALVEFEDTLRGEGRGPTNVLEEFQEIIELPSIETEELLQRMHPDTVTLRPVVVDQLRDLLQNVACMYNDNAFHNFEHASHVTASVRKLLTRIVDADQRRNSLDSMGEPKHRELRDLSGHSYGITSDPLTQFAVVFSAVIHDADHPGVPNAQLLKEKTRIAQIYKKSIAEQNSVELVWELLMSSAYDDLRACIYTSKHELERFRQLVVNTIMATDIADKELQNLRKMRWKKAFAETSFADTEPPSSELFTSQPLDVNRKATIVIEHLIQASDVSHTMQHWKIYRKWNKRLFFEQYGAFKEGRADKDPSLGWYEGEIGFFDFYVLPLAKKLDTCGVFGVSSQEYMNYAKSNRDEWVREGKQLVKEFLRDYNHLHPTGTRDEDTAPLSARSLVLV